MKNQHLKQQISKTYGITTKITIYSAVVFTIISLIMNTLKIDLEILIHFEWIVLSLMIVTPFLGTLLALIFYITKRDKLLIFATGGIITFVLLTILRGYIFK